MPTMPRPTARISVVTPMYNGSELIVPTMESVVAQTIGPVTHIVVDDGSRDGSADVVRQFAAEHPNVVPIVQANAGAAAARNRGVAELGPDVEYVVFLDHDDVLEPDALETLCATLDASPDVVAAYGQFWSIGPTGELLDPAPQSRPRWYVPDADRLWSRRTERREFGADAPTDYDVMAYWCAIQAPGLGMVRRSIVERCAFDVGSPITADYGFWLAVTRIGEVAFLPRPVLRYRSFETQMSANLRGMRRDLKRTHRKAIVDDIAAGVDPRGRNQFRHYEAHRAIDKLAQVWIDVRCGRPRAALADLVRAMASLQLFLAHAVPWHRFQRARFAIGERRGRR